MKFERRFHQLQDPCWTSHYLSYRKLKLLCKITGIGCSAQKPAINKVEDVTAALSKEINQVEQFCLDRLAKNLRWVTSFCEHHRLKDSTDHMDSIEIDPSVLRLFFVLLQDSIKELEERQEFADLNQAAAQRIRAKINGTTTLGTKADTPKAVEFEDFQIKMQKSIVFLHTEIWTDSGEIKFIPNWSLDNYSRA